MLSSMKSSFEANKTIHSGSYFRDLIVPFVIRFSTTTTHTERYRENLENAGKIVVTEESGIQRFELKYLRHKAVIWVLNASRDKVTSFLIVNGVSAIVPAQTQFVASGRNFQRWKGYDIRKCHYRYRDKLYNFNFKLVPNL